MASRVKITIWSDYVCPFCYLERPVLQQVQDEYGEDVDLEWRAFELRPEPAQLLDPNGQYLHTVWNQSVYPMARLRGMTLRLPPVQPRSRRALEAAVFARAHGRFEEMHEALFRAFFEDGRDLDDLEVLLEIGTSVGLDRDLLREALEQETYQDEVIQEEESAAELGVNAVPSMLVGRVDEPLEEAELVIGAQPYEAVREAIERVREGL